MNSGVNVTLPSMTKGCKYIIIATVALFILSSIVKQMGFLSPAVYLGLSGKLFFKGFIYQLFTYPFVTKGLIEVLFSSLLLWFLGSELEKSWGIKRYLTFLAVSAIGAGLAYLSIMVVFFSNNNAFSFPFTGLGGVGNALCLAYAILYPNRSFLVMFIFPVKAKYFCMILVAMQMYIGFTSSSGVLAWGHLSAMAFAFFYMQLVSSPKYKKFMEKRKMRKKNKANLTLIQGERGKDPKYFQ